MRLRQSLFSTYSIVARDPATGQLGVAVQTHQMCVGSRILWARPGLGAVITQSLSNISYAPMAGAMLREGIPPERIIAALVASDDRPEVRQVAVVDAQGRAAAFTGIGCIREAGHHTGEGYSVQANMMTHPTVVKAMAETYEAAQGDLAQRMLAALQAAQAEGGDIRGMQSAALKVVPADLAARDWAVDYDLRVDEHANPVSELARLVRLRHSQIADEAGYAALASGDRDRALALWQAARGGPGTGRDGLLAGGRAGRRIRRRAGRRGTAGRDPGGRSAPRPLAGPDRAAGRLRADRARRPGRRPGQGGQGQRQGPQNPEEDSQENARQRRREKSVRVRQTQGRVISRTESRQPCLSRNTSASFAR